MKRLTTFVSKQINSSGPAFQRFTQFAFISVLVQPPHFSTRKTRNSVLGKGQSQAEAELPTALHTSISPSRPRVLLSLPVLIFAPRPGSGAEEPGAAPTAPHSPRDVTPPVAPPTLHLR